jgi:protein-tyrosine phosphatase
MKVLFVCHGNAYRSPLAEALLKKLRPDLKVDSAGLHTAIPVSGEIKEYLRKLNALKYLKDFPESIDEKDFRDYDVIVTMDQKVRNAVLRKCPDCKNKIVAWNIKDPYFEEQEAKRIFNEIESKVRGLAGSL